MDFPITFDDQAGFDAAIKARLDRERRKVSEEVKAEFSDYEELRERAERAEQEAHESAGRLSEATARADELEQAAKARDDADKARDLRAAIASEVGVPSDLMAGDTEDDMRAWASKLHDAIRPATGVSIPGAGTFSHDVAKNSVEKEFVEFMKSNF